MEGAHADIYTPLGIPDRGVHIGGWPIRVASDNALFVRGLRLFSARDVALSHHTTQYRSYYVVDLATLKLQIRQSATYIGSICFRTSDAKTGTVPIPRYVST